MLRASEDLAPTRHLEAPATTLAFADEQRLLTEFNRDRFSPGLGEPESATSGRRREHALEIERRFVTTFRKRIARLLADVPQTPRAFIKWFENLRLNGPGQNDPLFPWLASTATHRQLCWFLQQEVAGEAGFDDLVAMTQVKMPGRAKLEMARNYWDEMGRGDPKGMHGPMLEQLATHLDLTPDTDTTVPEALALGNMMIALATNRAFAFHAVGALGVIEMTAPGRATYVSEGLDRLGVPKKVSHYFALHAVLDVKHSQAWNCEVLEPLVEQDPRRAKAIAEGAVLRLLCGKLCFDRYRREFGLDATAGDRH